MEKRLEYLDETITELNTELDNEINERRREYLLDQLCVLNRERIELLFELQE